MTKKIDLAPLLLDSRLISQANVNFRLKYDLKVIDCNDYIQIYKYKDSKFKNNKNNFDDKNDIKKIDTDNLNKKENKDKVFSIELKNIIRSKLKCQRIAKANSKDWKTFITLTFKENIIDVNIANKKLNSFFTSIRRIFNDFKYLCVPEFQKRGAVHYHLFTNIDINDKLLIYEQEDNKKFKHIKYWSYGYNKVDNISNDIKKVVGYISKYMTKDIDDRLFSHHRYYNSKNLNLPKENYIDLSNEKHVIFLNKLLKNKKIIYTNDYISKFDNEKIIFEEYL